MLHLDHLRHPFADLAGLPAAQRKQLAHIAKQNGKGRLETLANDLEWAAMELVDVVDDELRKVTHQLYVWPYGSGQLFEHDSTTETARIIQHAYQAAAGDLPFRKALAAAVAAFPLQTSIDFRLDWEPAAPTRAALEYAAARRALAEVLRPSSELRVFEELSNEQRERVLTAIRAAGDTGVTDLWELGVPSSSATPRWAGLAPEGPLEKRAGARPVWKWLESAVRADVTAADAVAAISQTLVADEVFELCLCVAESDEYNLFLAYRRRDDGDVNAYGMNVVRLLAAIVDASGDDAALVFARRVEERLARGPAFFIGAIATFALVARARRHHETFPAEHFSLALASNFLRGVELFCSAAVRDIVEVMTSAQRRTFDETIGRSFSITTFEGYRRDGRRVKAPTLLGSWWYADLLDPDESARKMIDAITRWDKNKKDKPIAQVLEAIQRVGPICVPHLDAALALKCPQHALLVAARKLF